MFPSSPRLPADTDGIIIIQYKPMKTGTILRFVIIGTLWLATCVWFVLRLQAAGTPLTLMSLFPLIASAFIVFVPLYKKYVKNGQKADSNKR